MFTKNNLKASYSGVIWVQRWHYEALISLKTLYHMFLTKTGGWSRSTEMRHNNHMNTHGDQLRQTFRAQLNLTSYHHIRGVPHKVQKQPLYKRTCGPLARFIYTTLLSKRLQSYKWHDTQNNKRQAGRGPEHIYVITTVCMYLSLTEASTQAVTGVLPVL